MKENYLLHHQISSTNFYSGGTKNEDFLLTAKILARGIFMHHPYLYQFIKTFNPISCRQGWWPDSCHLRFLEFYRNGDFFCFFILKFFFRMKKQKVFYQRFWKIIHFFKWKEKCWYSWEKKTGPWNGHSWGIFPSQTPEGISKNDNNITCT